MVRPQSPHYDERRGAIIDAAARLFAKRGFGGASISDIAHATGTAKSLVYHYFASKEELLHAVMADHLDDLVAAAREATQAGQDREKLEAVTRAFLHLYVDAADRHRVVVNELGNLADAHRTAIVAKQREIIGAIGSLVSRLRPGPPAEERAITMLLFGMINWMHTWYRPDGPVDVDRLAELAAGLALDGLGGAQAS